MTTLSNQQKAEIGKLAKAAWDSEAMAGQRESMVECNGELSMSAIFANWRHHQQQQVLGGGRHSLREATQEDYLRLVAHFRLLAGDEQGARGAMLRHQTEPQRVAMHTLERECKERGLNFPGYPGAICSHQNRCHLDQASAKQLWRLVYTVRSRRKALAA
jgi:hypothetical protein